MSCPVCGRVLCDHSFMERGQTFEGMMRDLEAEELAAVKSHSDQETAAVKAPAKRKRSKQKKD